MANELKMKDVTVDDLLKRLDLNGSFRSDELADEWQTDHQKLIGAVKSLQINPGLIEVENIDIPLIKLTEEGLLILKNGSHEFNVFKFVGEQGVSQAQLMNLTFAKDTVQQDLQVIDEGAQELPKEKRDALRKRNLITEMEKKVVYVSKGPEFQVTLVKPEVDLTLEMLASGSWKVKTFKKYNFEALGVPPPSGHLHPLLKVRSEFREIFFQMGFSEMETNRYVESSFWNFDALFQPQQHPARDSHDTFFISEPAVSTKFPVDYLEKVKMVHSKGGYGSIGYQYDWKVGEAQKNVLRTHTTAISARLLYKFAQQEYKPLKMFSIDRVFRNETLDATHLAEFHQVEGIIAQKNLSLAHVIGLFTEFFRKCGIQKLHFKPTYNPYTEPSMEIYAYHEGLGKMVEIGNSGIFRPEMLLPMGLPEDVNVAGFGLSLERPTMIRYGISNIRDLFGHKINLEKTIYNSPICLLDKSVC
uniref:phenylalanine--tRNA ligase n=1 Tax=Ditylenchus dipsaci TaxID=166011 RepID=A0A915CWU5_9BILA